MLYRSVPAATQPVTLSSVLHISTDARDCYALGVDTLFMKRILYGMSSDILCMGRGDLRHGWCIGSRLADYIQDIGATKPNASGAVVQATYLSPGFSDCGTATMRIFIQ